MLLYNASFLVLTLNPFIHASNLFRYFAKENNSNRDYINSFLPKGASISRIRCWYSSNVSCLYFSLSSFGIATQMILHPLVTYQQQKHVVFCSECSDRTKSWNPKVSLPHHFLIRYRIPAQTKYFLIQTHTSHIDWAVQDLLCHVSAQVYWTRYHNYYHNYSTIIILIISLEYKNAITINTSLSWPRAGVTHQKACLYFRGAAREAGGYSLPPSGEVCDQSLPNTSFYQSNIYPLCPLSGKSCRPPA